MSIKLIILIIFIAALLVLAFLLVFQRKKKRSSRRNRYIDALYALIRGESELALKLLTEAVKSGEDDAGAYLTLGNLLRERGQPDRALQVHMALQIRKDLRPHEVDEVQLAVADDYLEMGKIEKAVQSLERVSRKPRDRELLLRLHRLFHRSEQYERAFEILKQLSKVSGDFSKRVIASYLTSVSVELVGKGKVDEAKKYLEKAVKLDSSCPGAIFLLGKVAMEDGDMGRASDLWKRLLKENIAYFDDVKGYLERSLYEGGDFDAFERMLDDLLQMKPGELAVACALASFYRKKGDVRRAIDVLSEDMRAVRSNHAATILLAGLYLEVGEDGKAREILDRYESRGDTNVLYACPRCGSESEYPMFYCVECNATEEFIRKNAG